MHSDFNCRHNHTSAFQSIFPSNLEAFQSISRQGPASMFSHIDAILENVMQSSFHLNAFQGRIATGFFLDNSSWWPHILSNKCKNQVAAPKMVRQETTNALKLFLPFQVSQNHAPLPLKLWDKINFPYGHSNTAQYQGKETACHKKCSMNPKKTFLNRFKYSSVRKKRLF